MMNFLRIADKQTSAKENQFAMYIGRWQPLHEGHKYIFNESLEMGRKVDVMQKVYRYLELPYFEHNFSNIEQITVEDDDVYGFYGDHKINKTLKLPPSQANSILGKQVCDWIEQRFSWFYEKFKY